jgi:hypothetical protein
MALLPVSFRFFQPHFPLLERWKWFLLHHLRLRRVFEFFNVRMGHLSPKERSAFWELLLMHRMSTLAVGLIIQDVVKRMPIEQCYVNVGIWKGFTLFSGMLGNPEKRCIGIDNFCEFNKPRETFLQRFHELKSPQHTYIDQDFEEYFRSAHHGPIGVYMYDGAHDYESQMRGLEAAERFFVPGSIIIVDDTNWDAPRSATLNFAAKRGSAYRVVMDVSTSCEAHPTWWNGLLVLQKV